MQYLLKMIALTALFAGCTMSPAEPVQGQGAEPPQDTAYQSCPERRPEICTQEYRPVCGLTDDQLQHTYGNACTACGDEKVHGYITGECE